MQTTEGAELILASISAVLAIGVSWGIVRAKVHDLEKDIAALEARNETLAELMGDLPLSILKEVKTDFVSKEHFEPVINYVHQRLDTISEDTREILRLLKRS